MTRRFPEGFRWGAATSAYQIEGAVGRGRPRARRSGTRSAARPGAIDDGDTGDVACDHYHRYARRRRADGATSGSTSYRFSVAWPRMQPDGRGPANPAGLDFYAGWSTSCSAHGIEPW